MVAKIAKTVKEHTDQTDALIEHLKSGDELLRQARGQLVKARKALRNLEQFSHPAFEVNDGYSNGKPIQIKMRNYIVREINAISALLGDEPEQSA